MARMNAYELFAFVILPPSIILAIVAALVSIHRRRARQTQGGNPLHGTKARNCKIHHLIPLHSQVILRNGNEPEGERPKGRETDWDALLP
jgi:hypothetical protein